MEYQVELPNHDFVVAHQHKLIPSVTGDVKIVKTRDLANDAITYSGATYIGIRSEKHLGSATFTHLQGMKRVRSLFEFKDSFQYDRNEPKNVMIVSVDRGPDEDPRYKSTINCAIGYSVDNNLESFS